MSARLTRGEYWLLAKAATYRLPLPLLALPEGPPWDRATIDQAMNCEGHGMAIDELARTLHGLARRGWIEIKPTHASRPQVYEFEGLIIELKKGGSFSDHAYYGLTLEGGEVWETFARPRWHLYYDASCESIGDQISPEIWQGEVTTINRRTLDTYMQARRQEVDIVEDTEEIGEVTEWSMVYWKQPCRAWCCRFVLRERKHCQSDWRTTENMRHLWCEWQ